MPSGTGAYTAAQASGVGGLNPNAAAAAAAVAAAAAAGWLPPQGYPMPGYPFQPNAGMFRPPTGLVPSGPFGMPGTPGAAAASAAAVGIGRSPPNQHGQPHHLTAAALRSHQLQQAFAYSSSPQLQHFSSTGCQHPPSPGGTAGGGNASPPGPQQQQQQPQGPPEVSSGGNRGAGQPTNAVGASPFGLMTDRSGMSSDNRSAIAQQQRKETALPSPLPPRPPPSPQQQGGPRATPARSPAGLPPQAYLQTPSGQMHNPYAWFPRMGSDPQQHHRGGFMDYGNAAIGARAFPTTASGAPTGFLQQPLAPPPQGTAAHATALHSQPWLQQPTQQQERQQRYLQQHMQQQLGLPTGVMPSAMPAATADGVWNLHRDSSSSSLHRAPSPSSKADAGAVPAPCGNRSTSSSSPSSSPRTKCEGSSSSVAFQPCLARRASSTSQANSPVHRPSWTSPTSSEMESSDTNESNSGSGSVAHSTNRDRAPARGSKAGSRHVMRRRHRDKLESQLSSASSADAAALGSAELDTVSVTMASPREIQQMYHNPDRGGKIRRRKSMDDGVCSSLSSVPRSGVTRSSSSSGGTTVDGSSGDGASCWSVSSSRAGSGSDGQGSKSSSTTTTNGKGSGVRVRGQGAETQSGSTSSSESGSEVSYFFSFFP